MKKRVKNIQKFEVKKRFKMYKAKKRWIVVPIVFIGLIGGSIGSEALFVQASEIIPSTEKNENLERDTQSLPITELVKNTPNGLFYGEQINPSIDTGQSVGKITTPEDINGASNKALDMEVTYGEYANGGMEFKFPVYSNTNYTVKYRGRDVYELGAKVKARQGYKGSVVNGEWWRRDGNGSYEDYELKFTTTNNNKAYQDAPKEGNAVFYIYSFLDEDGGGTMKYRLLNAEIVPNTPIIQIDSKIFNLELSEVYGKTHTQIVSLLDSQINNFIQTASKDTNNNNNPVNTELGTVEDPDKIVTGATQFKIPITASKWGVNKNSFITVEVTDNISNEYPLQPVDPSGNPVTPTNPGKPITGKPGDKISVPKEDLPVVDGHTPNLPEDPEKPGNVLVEVPKDQQPGDPVKVPYTPVSNEYPLQPVDPSGNPVTPTNPGKPITGKPGDKISVPKEDLPVVDGHTPNLPEDPEKPGNVLVEVPKDQQPGDPVKVPYTPVSNEYPLQPVDPSGNPVTPTNPGKPITGKPGDKISVPKEDLPVVDGHTPNLPEDPEKPGNVLVEVPKDQQPGDPVKVPYTPVSNEYPLQPVDPSGNPVTPTNPGKPITGKPGDKISVPKEDLPVVDGHTPNLPEDPEKPGNVLVEVPKDQQPGDPVKVPYTPVSNEYPLQPVDPSGNPVTPTNPGKPITGKPGDKISVPKEDLPVVDGHTPNLPEDPEKPGNVLVEVPKDQQPGDPVKVPYTPVSNEYPLQPVDPSGNPVTPTNPGKPITGKPGDKISVPKEDLPVVDGHTPNLPEDPEKPGNVLVEVPKDQQPGDPVKVPYTPVSNEYPLQPVDPSGNQGDMVSVPKEVLPYVDNKNDSIKYSNQLPKTGEDNTVGLSLLGIIGVIGSLLGFLVFKNKNN